MPTPPLSAFEIQRRYEAYQQALAEGHVPMGQAVSSGKQGAIKIAAARLGVNSQGIYKAIKAHETAPEKKEPEVSLPVFPDDDIDALSILDHMAKRFKQRKAAADARKWFRVKVSTDEPIGITWFGDPHIGSNGCNVPLLRRDVDIASKTPGMYGANIGDTVDGWGGRLIKLYAENDVSKKTERLLARWFLRDSGVKWILWLAGNHDSMSGDFTHYMEACNVAMVPMIDWRAQFILAFPNGCEVKVDASHNHKGHSMWNPLHGQARAAHMEEPADLFIAGHHHTWATHSEELPDGRVVKLLRARGYKFMDTHAARWQFAEQQNGASIVTILDPLTDSLTERVKVFEDVEAGADYLTYLRGRVRGAVTQVKGGGNGKPAKRGKT